MLLYPLNTFRVILTLFIAVILQLTFFKLHLQFLQVQEKALRIRFTG
jgi:hypothetical protein